MSDLVTENDYSYLISRQLFYRGAGEFVCTRAEPELTQLFLESRVTAAHAHFQSYWLLKPNNSVTYNHNSNIVGAITLLLKKNISVANQI